MRILICLFLITLTFLTYSQVLDYEFLNLDDDQYVTENTHIIKGFNYKFVIWAFTQFYASNWHPLTWLSHMLDFEVYGLDPLGHHLTNLTFHIFNILLLFGVLLKMTGRVWRSAFVAFLFALHPLNVESVAWIAERKNVLSGFFFFLTLWAYLHYLEKKQYYWIIFLFFGLGLMAKPMLVTLPFLLLLLDFWPLKRLRLGEIDSLESGINKGVSLGRLITEKGPLFILVIGSSVITYFAQREGGAVISNEFRSFYSIAANALVSYVEYLRKMLWPRDLSVFYPHLGDGIAEWKALTCGIFLALVTILIVRFIRKVPYLTVGWFWYLGTLVPVIGIVQVGEQSMADRYTYLAMIGVFICIAWGIPELIKNQKILSVMAAIYIVLLTVTTWGQIKYWKNSITLFEHAISINENETPNFVIAYNNLGHALLTENRFQEAIVKFQRAIKINPNYSKPQNNLGSAFSELKKYDQSIKHYQQAIKIEPNYAEAFNNLAKALRQTGKINESIVYFKEAIRLKKNYGDAYFNLGVTLSQQGQIGEAIVQYQKALEINSNFVMAHNNLASLLAQRKDIAGAIRHYKEAINIDPEFAQAHNNLGSTLGGQGKIEEAIIYLNEAIRLKKDYDDAYFNLGITLSQQGQIGEAIGLYQKALEINSKFVMAHNNLASLLAQSKDIAGAIRHYKEAINIDPEFAQAHNNLGSTLAGQGKIEEAILFFEKALSIDPNYIDAQNNLKLARSLLVEE